MHDDDRKVNVVMKGNMTQDNKKQKTLVTNKPGRDNNTNL
jgi:hypothetical protein